MKPLHPTSLLSRRKNISAEHLIYGYPQHKKPDREISSFPHAGLPFIICKFISVVIRWYNIHQQNVLRFWIKSSDLHFVTGEHTPIKNEIKQIKTQVKSGEGKVFQGGFVWVFAGGVI